MDAFKSATSAGVAELSTKRFDAETMTYRNDRKTPKVRGGMWTPNATNP